jgi:hypothetical protein
LFQAGKQVRIVQLWIGLFRANIECGGWCPNGRRAEDGKIRRKYPLTETPSANYEQRTAAELRSFRLIQNLLEGPR